MLLFLDFFEITENTNSNLKALSARNQSVFQALFMPVFCCLHALLPRLEYFSRDRSRDPFWPAW